MRYAAAVLAMATVAMAQFKNGTSSTSAPSPTGTPGPVGPYDFFGCLVSPPDSKFPGFVKVSSSADMTLDLCAAAAKSTYFGVIGETCFQADSIDPSIKKTANGDCNMACPGDKTQFCGGMAPKMSKRQDIPAGSAMSVYKKKDGGGGTTTTKTVTSTYVGTITSCPPAVTDCPIGSKTTHVVVKTTEVCPTPYAEWHKKTIICYGDYCTCPSEKKDPKHKYRVICDGDKCHTEKCDTKEWNKLVICKGNQCKYSQCKGNECSHKKVVCYDGKCVVAKCSGDECSKNWVCKGDDCKHQTCTSKNCHATVICDPNGKNCKTQQPCHGSNCPAPPAPHKTVTVVAHKPTPGPNNNGNKPHGDEGKNKPINNNGNKPHGDEGKNKPNNNDNKPNNEGKNKPQGDEGKNKPTGDKGNHPVVVAGAGNVVANVLGAAAGLLFVL